MTARDSYRRPGQLLRGDQPSCAGSPGTQLDPAFVEIFVELLADKDIAYRHGEDADFERELALDRRIHEYVTAGTTTGRGSDLSPPAGSHAPSGRRIRRIRSTGAELRRSRGAVPTGYLAVVASMLS